MTGGTVEPIWFGPEERPLFGWLHRPVNPTGVGVALCPAIGLDGEASQFAYRELARPLVEVGCTVLRFDYDGTGDSAGAGDDPDRLVAWTKSIGVALATLRGSGCRTLHLVGTRLGVALAARAAAEDGDVATLSAWYPTASGSQFLRYQRALRRLYSIDGSPEVGGGATEIPGYVLDVPTTADVKVLQTWDADLHALGSLMVLGGGESDVPEASSHWPEHIVRVEGTGSERLFGVELMKAVIDPNDVDALVRFITDQPGPSGPGPLTPQGRPWAVVGGDDTDPVVERAIVLEGSGIFAMLCERQSGSVSDGPSPRPRFGTAIFLNAGSLHHIGPGRQWVELSRAWAAAGVRCLRLDIGGVGESPLTGPPGVLSSYPPNAVADIEAAVEMIAPGHRRDVVLLGLCSGAYHCMLAGPSIGVGAVALVNPLRMPVPAGSGTQLDPYPSEADRPLVEAARQGAPLVAPKRFLGDLRDRGALQPLVRHLPDRAWSLLPRSHGRSDPAEVFRRVVDSGVELLVVCGPEEWRTVGRGHQAQLKRMAATDRFHLAMVPTLDHSFHVADGRQRAVQVLSRWILDADAGTAEWTGDATIVL